MKSKRNILFSRWRGMMARCNYKDHHKYHIYGARGIRVEWKTFNDFYLDMGGSFTSDKTLDRVNNDGNYCKENCRWSTPKEQGNNKRTNRTIEYAGQKKTLAEWAALVGIPYSTLRARLAYGFSTEDSFEYPVGFLYWRRQKKGKEII